MNGLFENVQEMRKSYSNSLYQAAKAGLGVSGIPMLNAYTDLRLDRATVERDLRTMAMACSPKTEPSLVRVPMTPGWGILETLDEAKTAHS
jgi:hypothetical protein